jgi:hypothetical protein
MFPNTELKITALAVAIMIVATINGCSVIGFTVGAMKDNSKPDSLQIAGYEAEKIKPGKNVKITMNNGRQLQGKYRGLHTLPQDVYSQRFNAIREKSSPDFIVPKLNDDIVLTLNSGNQVEREFLGFDFRNQLILLEDTSTTNSPLNLRILTKVKGNPGSQNFPSRIVDKISDREGKVYQTRDLEKLAFVCQIPFSSAIAFENQDSMFLIPGEEVSRIELKNGNNDKWIGLGIGAVIDAGLIITAIIISQSWGGTITMY